MPNLCFFLFSSTSSQNKVATRVAACTFNIESAVYDATKKEGVHTYTSTRKHAVYDTYKKRGALDSEDKKRFRTWACCPLPHQEPKTFITASSMNNVSASSVVKLSKHLPTLCPHGYMNAWTEGWRSMEGSTDGSTDGSMDVSKEVAMDRLIDR